MFEICVVARYIPQSRWDVTLEKTANIFNLDVLKDKNGSSIKKV